MNEHVRMPQPRNIVPPNPMRTRLFAREGRFHAGVLHHKKGFLVGRINGSPLWSHDPTLASFASSIHPDIARTLETYIDEQTARRETRRFLTLHDAMSVTIIRIKADCAEGSDDRLAEGPTERCSVLAACALTHHLAAELRIRPLDPLPHHAFDPTMRGLATISPSEPAPR